MLIGLSGPHGSAPAPPCGGSGRDVRVLVVGHGASERGFGRVARGIVEQLSHRFAVSHFSPYGDSPEFDAPWRFIPSRRAGDAYGIAQLPAIVEATRPDVVLLIDDLFTVPLRLRALRGAGSRPTVIAYVPIDDEYFPPGMLVDAAKVDRLVAYTETGVRVFGDTVRGSRPAAGDAAPPPIDVIPHGVDHAVFRPLGGAAGGLPRERARAREEVFGRSDLDFIVLNANRNQPRKRIDITIEGFARFAAGKPDGVKLCLHTAVADPRRDLTRLMRRFRIADRVLMTGEDPRRHPTASDQELNLIYNACDVGINTSTTEGWGLVSFEHAATGAAQIVSNFGVRAELWDAAAVLLPTRLSNDHGVVEHVATPAGVADALERLYIDRAFLRRMSAAGFARATERRFTWASIADQWSELVINLAKETKL